MGRWYLWCSSTVRLLSTQILIVYRWYMWCSSTVWLLSSQCQSYKAPPCNKALRTIMYVKFLNYLEILLVIFVCERFCLKLVQLGEQPTNKLQHSLTIGLRVKYHWLLHTCMKIELNKVTYYHCIICCFTTWLQCKHDHDTLFTWAWFFISLTSLPSSVISLSKLLQNLSTYCSLLLAALSTAALSRITSGRRLCRYS